ncbi:heavy-metal-associated domain-containing protein [Bosea beijingensis]|uniref:heavy-metal-associated domain-containing protein n=1 Tax=Bosea beijingensis TaxID=3068632 RepID=UPI002741FB01|nr:heavy-metal-associated domain-containing protein [Bosea sp. REN20]
MAENSSQTLEFKIEGMDCGHCVSSIEKAIRALPGVEAVKVSLSDKSAIVKHDPAAISQHAVFEAVEDAGFDVPR